MLAFDVKGREEILKSFSEMTVQFFNLPCSKRRIAIDDPVPVSMTTSDLIILDLEI